MVSFVWHSQRIDKPHPNDDLGEGELRGRRQLQSLMLASELRQLGQPVSSL